MNSMKKMKFERRMLLGDNHTHEVRVKGIIPIRMVNGDIKKANDVLVVPGLKKNVLSDRR